MTQSLSVWRSMPAHFAASARLMPSSALAIPNRRREMRASGSDLASLRSTVDVRSLRIFSFAIARLLGRIAPTMESELKAAGNRWTATRVELYARRYETKFQKSRLLPLHATVRHALDRYLSARRDVTGGNALFVSGSGRPLPYNSVRYVFLTLLDRAGLRGAHAG